MPVTGYLTRGERWRLGLTAAVWVADLLLLPFAPFAVLWPSFVPVAVCVAVLALVWTVYTLWRPAPPLAAAALATAQLLVFVLGAAFLNYLGFMAGRPLFDVQMVAADAALGFDWLRFTAWVTGLAGVGPILLLAYESSMVQVAAIIAVLALTGRFARLDEFVLAFMLSALITVGVWTLVPTFGAYVHYYSLGVAPPSAGLAVDPAYAASLIGMHGGVFAPLRFDTIVGLIGLPSFHTCLAVLCAVALRGVRWLGPAFLLLNALVLFSVPAQGGHHLVDVFAGIAATAAAIWIARRILARGEALSPLPRLAVSGLPRRT